MADTMEVQAVEVGSQSSYGLKEQMVQHSRQVTPATSHTW